MHTISAKAAAPHLHAITTCVAPPTPVQQHCSPTKELSVQTARVLKLLLPGLRIRCSVLTKATAAGTDFSKVGGIDWIVDWLPGGGESCSCSQT